MSDKPQKVEGSVEVNPGCMFMILLLWLIWEIEKSADRIIDAIQHIK